MALLRKVLIFLFMLNVKIVVTIYTIITFPIYFIYNKPWKVYSLGHRMRSRRENLNDSTSPIIRNESPPVHPLLQSATYAHLFEKMLSFYGNDRVSLGYREVLSEELQTDAEGNQIKVDGKVLKKYRLSDYKWLTLKDVDNKIDAISKGLLFNGVKPDDKVLILSETRVEWFLTAHAIFRIGGVVVTLFATLGDDGIVHGINETEVNLIVTTHDLMDKLKYMLSKTPKVNKIVYIDGLKPLNHDQFPSHLSLIPFSQLISDGGKEENQHLIGRFPKSDDIALIMYTSGTTGKPKGVILTHKQAVSTATSILSIVKDLIYESHKHVYIAYLPLAHIFEFTIQSFIFGGGVRIGYSTPFTLSDSSPGLAHGVTCDVKLLSPTAMITVPLVLDRIRKEIYAKLKARTPVSVDIFNYLMNYKQYWTSKGYRTPLTNKMLCSKVREQLGGRIEHVIVGGAPISANTQSLIKAALNVNLCQGYGATETCGPVIGMDFDDMSYGRIGGPLSGVKIKLINWEEGGYRTTDEPNPRGELIVGGNSIANGYFNLEEETREAFEVDASGCRWFHSGDIAEMFPDGTFSIIDRRKDLIKLQNGEYVSLGKIETALKVSPYVDNICVVGSALSNYLVAIIVPNHKSFNELAFIKGKSHMSREKLCSDNDIIEEVYESIVTSAKDNKLRRIEIPKKITLVSEEWTPENDMLTAAMKLKRRNVITYYKSEIDYLFQINSNENISNNNNNNNNTNCLKRP